MANPQVENGHIDIANEIGEVLARTQLSGYESRILWAIWRKTYGWHKKNDAISITQFEKATGLKRRHIHRTLQRLLDRHIVTKNGNGFIGKWAFQKDYRKWKNLITKIGNKMPKKQKEKDIKEETITKTGNGVKNGNLLPKMVTRPINLVTKNGTHKRNKTKKNNKPVKSGFQTSQNSKNLEEEIDKLIELYKNTYPEHIRRYKLGAIVAMRDLIKSAVSRGAPLEAVRDRIKKAKTGTPWEILTEKWIQRFERAKTPEEIIEYQKKRLGWSPYEQVERARQKPDSG